MKETRHEWNFTAHFAKVSSPPQQSGQAQTRMQAMTMGMRTLTACADIKTQNRTNAMKTRAANATTHKTQQNTYVNMSVCAGQHKRKTCLLALPLTACQRLPALPLPDN
eukprot:3799877-Amphidinium_carterae.1